jgi:hypothetical protein
VPLDIFDVIQLGCERILNIDDYDLPVCFSFIEKSHDTEDFDLLDLPDITDLFTDLTNIKRIIITLRLCLGVGLSGIFPSLQ